MALRVALETLEWIPPHKPRSEEAVTYKVLASSPTLVSAASKRANKNWYEMMGVYILLKGSRVHSPPEEVPKARAASIAFWDLATLVEAIIFIDLVIFSMLLTDFKRC
jgi:hypothetical protein